MHPQPSFLKTGYSPFLNRAGMHGRGEILARMAEDLRHCAASADCVTEADLELLGWTPEQIATHGAAAGRKARANAARDIATRPAREHA